MGSGAFVPAAGLDRSALGPLVIAAAHVQMMEDHDGALDAWREAGMRERTVVHVDPHLDFSWVPANDPQALLGAESLRELERSAQGTLWNFGRRSGELVHIGNYLHPAIQEGLVGTLVWVVPDGFMETDDQRMRLAGILERLRRSHPDACGAIAWDGPRLTTRFYDAPVCVCILDDLPPLDEPVLLDVDSDFCVIDRISAYYPHPEPGTRAPWIWPEELLDRLRARAFRTDFVTIAYSVNGGYTPLELKFLGDELALRFCAEAGGACDGMRDAGAPGGLEEAGCPDWMRLLHLVVTARATGDRAGALELCRLLLSQGDVAPGSAAAANGGGRVLLAPVHGLAARLSFELGDAQAARRYWQAAVAFDAAYRTRFSTDGVLLLELGRVAEAEERFREALAYDPDAAHPYAGLGDVCLARRAWGDAVAHYGRSLDRDPDHLAALYGLGVARAKLGDWSSAEPAWQRVTADPEFSARAYYWLAESLRRRKQWKPALDAYRQARRAGLRSLEVHGKMAALYARLGNWYKARRYAWDIVKALPSVARLLTRRTARWIRRERSGGRRGRRTTSGRAAIERG